MAYSDDYKKNILRDEIHRFLEDHKPSELISLVHDAVEDYELEQNAENSKSE